MQVHRYGVAVLVLAGLTFVPIVTEVRASDAEARILEQLICKNAPDALPVLIVLEKEGRINPKEGLMADSSTCWELKPDLMVRGMAFSHICASSEDPKRISAYPDFFWRGPGTSPGESLELLSKEPRDLVRGWAEVQLGSTDGKFGIAASWLVEGASAVSCGSTSFSQ